MTQVAKAVLEAVYQTIQQIPRGKVSTYGTISNYINKHLPAESFKLTAKITPRMVAHALRERAGNH